MGIISCVALLSAASWIQLDFHFVIWLINPTKASARHAVGFSVAPLVCGVICEGITHHNYHLLWLFWIMVLDYAMIRRYWIWYTLCLAMHDQYDLIVIYALAFQWAISFLIAKWCKADFMSMYERLLHFKTFELHMFIMFLLGCAFVMLIRAAQSAEEFNLTF